jgi:hypothetical protein
MNFDQTCGVIRGVHAILDAISNNEVNFNYSLVVKSPAPDYYGKVNNSNYVHEFLIVKNPGPFDTWKNQTTQYTHFEDWLAALMKYPLEYVALVLKTDGKETEYAAINLIWVPK